MSIKIKQDGVYKIPEEGEKEKLEKVGEKVTMLEDVFYRPIGGNFKLEFYNDDENTLYVITGSKQFFKPIEIPSKEKKKIKVKSDFKGNFRFGVAPVGRVLNSEGKREFSATMFELCHEGKMVKINKTSVGFTAAMEKPDGTETELVQTAAKTFNESNEFLSFLKQGETEKHPSNCLVQSN